MTWERPEGWRTPHLKCIGCGAELTDEERQFYLGQCNGCVEKDSARFDAWIAGANDPELDEAFGPMKTDLQKTGGL